MNLTDWTNAEALFAEGLSVVLPFHNLADRAEANLARLDTLLRPHGFPYRIVAVDDGSTDATAEALCRTAETLPAIQPVLLPANAGKGAALLAGLERVSHPWVLLLDGDLDLDPAALPAFADIAHATGADLILGDKRHPQSQVHYPLRRRVASVLYAGLVRALLRLPVSDTQCGMKLVRAEVLRYAAPRLLVKRFAFDLEFLAVAHDGGFRHANAPVRLDFCHRWGCLTPATVWRTLIDTLAIAYRARFLHYYAGLTPLPPPPSDGSHFTLIVPCPGDSAVLRRLLNALDTQAYRHFDLVLLPDAPIPDFPERPWLSVRPTGPMRPAQKRNLGARAAKGEVLAFIDDDAYPRTDWLANAAARLSGPDAIAALGGPGLTPPDDPPSAQLSGLVLASPLVSGNFRYRYFIQGPLRRVEDFPSCNLFVRKSAFEAIGGFRENYWPGEDTLLCADLQTSGHALWYDPRLVVYHHRRPLFGPHLRQVGRYALHRGHFARRFGLNSRRLSYHLPSLFLLGLLLGPLAIAFLPLLAIPYCAIVLLWLGLTGVDALVEAPTPRAILPLWLGILATHLVYGARFLQGYLAPALPNTPRPFDHR